MKRARQAEILKIIQSVDVETQEQLLDELKRRGFASTQATISRDIKELRLVKEMAGGGIGRSGPEYRGGAHHARSGLGGLLGPGQHGHSGNGGQPGRR